MSLHILLLHRTPPSVPLPRSVVPAIVADITDVFLSVECLDTKSEKFEEVDNVFPPELAKKSLLLLQLSASSKPPGVFQTLLDTT